uniref:Uncharacterized protein n=1 Tax=Siphoviridae sp. ctKwY15 TaxID=2827843 RepID=A0A8S5SUK1_9CAUD|nr:MAG TPA: hypothetical protein [Siphoviridae sp. ctKwY15]
MDVRLKQCLALINRSLDYHPDDTNLLQARNILSGLVNGYNVVEDSYGICCWRILD